MEGWREHFRPTVIGAIRIRPPWESPAPGPVTSNEEPALGRTGPPAAEQSLCPIDVVINPGLGFGTGLHPTTRGTLLLLQQGAELAPPGVAGRGALVDVGTGSGILAIAAARLGWAPVIALDNDPVAVASARENVALNLVEPQVEVHGVDVAHARRAWFRGATVLANMTLEPVSLLLRRLSAEGVHPRRLVVSGILAGSQEERLLRVADECGHSPGRRLYDEEWVSLELIPGQAES
jgi:ribosomal protein L11 methyltransferase